VKIEYGRCAGTGEELTCLVQPLVRHEDVHVGDETRAGMRVSPQRERGSADDDRQQFRRLQNLELRRRTNEDRLIRRPGGPKRGAKERFVGAQDAGVAEVPEDEGKETRGRTREPVKGEGGAKRPPGDDRLLLPEEPGPC
jgi:hypothetical protein